MKPRPLLYLSGRAPTCTYLYLALSFRARFWKHSNRSNDGRSDNSRQSRNHNLPQTSTRSRMRPHNERSDEKGLTFEILIERLINSYVSTFRFSTASWTLLESSQFALASSKSGTSHGTTAHTATLSTSVSFASVSSSTLYFPPSRAPSQSSQVPIVRAPTYPWWLQWPPSSTAASMFSSSSCFFTRPLARRS